MSSAIIVASRYAIPPMDQTDEVIGTHRALRWLPPTTTVLYLTLNPITAMVLGIVLLGEKLTAELIAGMALVLIGILVGSSAFSAQERLT